MCATYDIYFLYSSLWAWFRNTTIYCGLGLIIACMAIFIAMLFQEINYKETIDWWLVISCSLIPLMVMYPFIWVGTYYYSFIRPKRITKKVQRFISSIPNVTDIKQISITNYTFLWNNIEFEVAYDIIPKNNPKRKKSPYSQCFIMGLYYSQNKAKNYYSLMKMENLQHLLLKNGEIIVLGKKVVNIYF